MAWSLVPKEERFFSEFISLTEQIRSGARLLKQMLAGSAPDMAQVAAIKEVEHACDRSTRSIIDRLNRTFVTPLDREDIHALASKLDDVMDAIDAAASVMRLYKIEQVRPEARELSRIIVQSADQVSSAMKSLARLRGVVDCAVEINRLENEADRVHQAAVRTLFEEERDTLTIIKWKELLDFLEAATDRCEDVANVLEAVVVKHA